MESTTYLATFDRIGRQHNVPALAVHGTPEDIALQVYRVARKSLVSSEVDVVVNLDEMKGTIFAGMQVGGNFTLEVQS